MSQIMAIDCNVIFKAFKVLANNFLQLGCLFQEKSAILASLFWTLKKIQHLQERGESLYSNIT